VINKVLSIDSKNKGILFAIIAAICYGTSPFFIETFFAYGGTTQTYTIIKNVFVMLLMFLTILVTKQSFKLPIKRALHLIIAGTLSCGFVTLLLTKSYDYLGGGVATTLHFTYPLFTAAISCLYLRTKLPAYKWILLCIVCASIPLFVDISNSGANWLGIGLAISSGVAFAVYIVLSGVWGIGSENPMQMMLYMALGGFTVAAVAFLVSRESLVAFDIIGLPYALIAIIVDAIIGNIFFQKSIKYLNGTETAFFSVMEPVTSVIVNAIFLGQIPTKKTVLGVVIILGSVIIMVYCDNIQNTIFRKAKNK